MNTALLLQWLNLPPGPWPPEERALLGLAAGPIDSAQAESNALARMELLRPHQLKHPEVVTEGMNRLAQALISLSAPVESNSPTISLRKPVRRAHAKPVAQPLAPATPRTAAFPIVDLAPAGPAIAAPVAPQSIVLEAEVIVEAEVVSPSAPVALEAVSVVEAPPPGLIEIPEIPRSEDRRKSYRRLAYLRELHRVWLSLQPVVAVPSESLTSAEMIYRLLAGLRELRPLLPFGKARFRALKLAGGSVQALAAQAQPVLVLRELLPVQRQALALDWATAKAAIEAQMLAVRRSLKRPRTRRVLVELGRSFGLLLQQNPEWILGACTALLILSGVIRTLAR